MSSSETFQEFSARIARFTQSAEEMARRERAALRLKERLSSVPFYANRAAKYRAEGGAAAELAYWRRLHGSAALSD